MSAVSGSDAKSVSAIKIPEIGRRMDFLYGCFESKLIAHIVG